jgi:uncharacterized RDD family membrane protein YckC
MYSKEEKPTENKSSGDLLFYDQPIYVKDNYAGFWLRFGAYMIDFIVCFVILFIFSMLFGVSMAFGGDSDNLEWGALGLIAVMYIAIILYFPILESSSWQATIGKRAVGIKVIDLDGRRIGFGRALGRFFAKIISGIILYIGYIMAGFTERKQALHDIIAGTLVIKDNEKILQ